jgi:hypothetical protein
LEQFHRRLYENFARVEHNRERPEVEIVDVCPDGLDDLVPRLVDWQIAPPKKLLAKRDLELIVTDKARQELSNRGYDPQFGARPLKRVIQNELQNPLASELLKGEYPEGSTVKIDYDGVEFTFTKVATEGGKARDKVVSSKVV